MAQIMKSSLVEDKDLSCVANIMFAVLLANKKPC